MNKKIGVDICIIEQDFGAIEAGFIALIEQRRHVIVDLIAVPVALQGFRPELIIIDDVTQRPTFGLPREIHYLIKPELMPVNFTEANKWRKPHGWYRKFEKLHGKRNLK